MLKVFHSCSPGCYTLANNDDHQYGVKQLSVAAMMDSLHMNRITWRKDEDLEKNRIYLLNLLEI